MNHNPFGTAAGGGGASTNFPGYTPPPPPTWGPSYGLGQPQQQPSQQQPPLSFGGISPPAPAPPRSFGASSSSLNHPIGSSTTPFGTNRTNAAGTGFGSHATSHPFGSANVQPPPAASTFGFGTNHTTFGTTTLGGTFGTNNNNPPSTLPISSSPFGGGGPPSSTPFGSTPPPHNPPPPFSPFTVSSTTHHPITTHATTSQFGNDSTSTSHHPFGRTPAAASSSSSATASGGLSFGTSTNIVSGFGANHNNHNNYNNHQRSSGFNAGSSSGYPVLGGMPNPSDLDMRTSPAPTGLSPQSMSPMRGHSDNEDMMGDADDTQNTTNTAFGGSHTKYPSASQIQQPFGTTWNAASSSSSNIPFPTATTTSLSPIPEAEPSIPGNNHNSTSHSDDRLAQLKAKLEMKKKKYEEKRKKEEESKSSPIPLLAPPPPQLNPKATEFQPSSSALAERNALRFATNNKSTGAGGAGDTRSYLPSDLISNETTDANTTMNTSNIMNTVRSDREDIGNAVSLVGTCQFMCPDEEIMRREREGDIQLLEKPLPEHPKDWTLRQTMVKRFRRSAADYKLDVPEWVRPPDVLERVCGYLEEWVMERDRQGPDQRFIDSAFNFKGDRTPPSLDVYQFIWDRTRMVRKDFILQNFVGSGGKCDARAVRCHERIARWHAMCEHQLSHIAEFVSQQSQQNIQELGQTMKTLNQYYDDPLNRSIVEVPDEQGNETRTDLSDCNHGCQANCVQGTDPVDFDRTPLLNDDNPAIVGTRLLGGMAAVSGANHGTAEPEMRGLYILLTLENDGGMEVLKYAARLYQLRPDVYQTVPVQLALSIYKARKEYNYARFFSILRAPTTPYLFGCIMFKYVENMRKYAFRIMSKTYGGRSRENEAIYDSYPIRDLTNLLCYEDDDEARAACQHYNIAVRKDDDGVETIFWRQTSFKEPKDPDKGTTIRLLPRKMMRTIESKGRGMTRLAVCRGQVSGDGAYLACPQQSMGIAETPEEKARRDEIRKAALQEQEIRRRKQADAEEAIRQQEAIKRKELEQRQLAEQERKRLEEEKKRLELLLRQKQEQEERERAEKRRLAQELERQRKEQELEDERRRVEEAEIRRRDEIIRLESLRRQAEEKEQQERIKENERRRQMEAEQRRQHEEMLQRAQEERLRLEKEEAENQRKEKERRRMEALQREREERARQAAEELRLRQEAECRVIRAKKKLILRRMLHKLPHHLSVEDQMSASLDRVSPLATSSHSSHFHFARKHYDRSEKPPTLDIRRSLELALKSEHDLSQYLAQCIMEECEDAWYSNCGRKSKATLLFKVAIILPRSDCYEKQSLCDLTRTWINTRIGFGRVSASRHGSVDVRVVVVDGHDKDAHPECDAVVFVIPPAWCDDLLDQQMINDMQEMALAVDPDMPRIVFALSEHLDASRTAQRQSTIVPILSGSFSEVMYVENIDAENKSVDHSLSIMCEMLAKSISCREPLTMEKIPVGDLIIKLLPVAIRQDFAPQKRDDILVNFAKLVNEFVEEIDSAVTEVLADNVSWPAKEFAVSDRNRIDDYFGAGEHLGMDWMSSLSPLSLDVLTEFSDSLDGPLPQVVWGMLHKASFSIQKECEDLLHRRSFQLCLQTALSWKIQNDTMEGRSRVIFAPRSLLQDAMERAIARHEQSFECRTLRPRRVVDDLYIPDANFIDNVDFPPVEAPAETLGAMLEIDSAKSPWIARAHQENDTKIQDVFVCDSRLTQEGKRRHSNAEITSMNFTKRLKRLLAGDDIKDMIIGKITLAGALRSAPPIKLND